MCTVVNKVPPDGGYGWVVTFAYALNNVVVLPLIAGFGLVFQEAFSETGLTATQGTLIITLNHGIGMLLSFFGGPLLRRFGYRKVAVVGAIFISVGLILTSYSSTFWMFILSYSIINSMGIAAVMAAFTLAINSFFKEKRGRAIGVGMSITGLGAIYMPLLMSALIYAYGWRYAVLILSAICLHSLLAATLLRPAKWYLKYPPKVEELEPLNKEDSKDANARTTAASKLNGVPTLPQLQVELPNCNNSSLPKSVSMKSLTTNKNLETKHNISHHSLQEQPNGLPLKESQRQWWQSQQINLSNSINNVDDNDGDEKLDPKEVQKVLNEKKQDAKQISYIDKFIDFFDLTLLSDPIFVNILFGLSIASCVETNFSLLLPIILRDMLEMDTGQIAQVMAVIGFSDTLFRLVSPFIGEICRKPPRVMYLFSLLIIIITRSAMLWTTTFRGMLLLALIMGVTKGVRTVYMNIVIPSYVPLERLPFASGIQMFVNGIIIITIGSLLGRIRELSGAYNVPIMMLNVVTFVTVILWTAEFAYFRFTKSASKPCTDT